MLRQELIDSSPCDNICCYRGTDTNAGACCLGCSVARKEFYENGGLPEFDNKDRKTVKSCWDDKKGFSGNEGCRLPRRLMPTECLEYTCKDKIVGVFSKWQDGQWKAYLTAEWTPDNFIKHGGKI